MLAFQQACTTRSPVRSSASGSDRKKASTLSRLRSSAKTADVGSVDRFAEGDAGFGRVSLDLGAAGRDHVLWVCGGVDG